jgi:glycosyltransferase involved in cell wall biosynthesis
VTAYAPLVSVVVPAYNSAGTLEQTVRSVLGQTVRDLETIIVDDGSSDDTLAVARAIEDPRVRVLTRENGGASAARNTGIEQAKGTWVAFVDSDDVWLPEKLERQLTYLDAHPDVHAVQTGAFIVDADLRVLHVRACKPSQDALWETLLFQNLPAFPSTVMIRRSKLEEIGFFDTRLEILEDWDLAIRASRFCNLRSIEEPLTLYRTHPGNRSLNLDIHIAPGLSVLERLFDDPDLPEHVRAGRSLVYAHLYTMLAGGALKVGRYPDCVRWAFKALRADPRSWRYMAGLPLRRINRLASGFMHRRGSGVPRTRPPAGHTAG